MTPAEKRKRDWEKRQRQLDWQRRQAEQQQQPRTTAPQQQPPGVFESFQTGLAGPLLRNVIETGADLYNAPLETLERAGRAGLEFISAFDPAGNAYQPTVRDQAARVAELNRLADERLPETVRLMKVGQQVEEARARTRAGNVALGVGSVLGEVAFPTAPEGAVSNLVLGPAAGVAARGINRAVVSPLMQRITRGRGVPTAPVTQAVDSALPDYPVMGGPPALEALPPKPYGVRLGKERQQLPGRVGPAIDQYGHVLDGPGAALEAKVAEAAARSPWQDTVLAYYRANLLTNPAGRALDLGSTIINQAASAVARPIAAAADVVVSKLTGRRSITGPSLRGTGQALGSIRQGLRDAREVLRTGQQAIDSGDAAALYGSEIVSGIGKGFDVPVNGLFRVLGALDAPFRRFGYARNLFDRARVQALNEVRYDTIPKGQLSARIRELMDDPDIIKAAVRDGERAVLSEPNKISTWLSQQTHNSANARLAIGIVQPFMRIPLNAVHHAADFAGLGGLKVLYKIARGVGRKSRGHSFFRDLEDQRIFSQNVAAGSFAPAGFLLGMELEEQGRMEGFYYTSKRDFPNGKVPTSININGENYDINRLGGYVMAPLFIGATFNRLRKQNVGKANALLRSFSALVQTAPALGYHGVPAKLGRLLTAEEPGSEIIREAGSIASGFIPASGATGFAAKALDPVKKRHAEGFTGPIMNRLPGLRQRLPEKPPVRRRGR